MIQGIAIHATRCYVYVVTRTTASRTAGPAASTAQRAREAISASGIRQRHLAQQMGIDDSKLSKSLAGVRKFSATELSLLAQLTGVTVEWLLAGNRQSNPTNEHDRHRDHDHHITDRAGAQTTVRQRTRRHCVVVAAWRLFASRGYSRVTIDDIARATSMSPAAVLYYFENKNAIFLATLRYCSDLAAQSQTEALQMPDPVQALRALARTQLPTTEQTRLQWATWAQFWSAAPTFPDAKEVNATAYQRWLDTITTLIQTGHDQGLIVDAPVGELRDLYAALIDGFGIRVLTGGLDPDRAVDLADRTIVRHFATDTSRDHHTTMERPRS
ncbi:TetR family transcriptional regulator [Auritidibacter sp. NML100628]|nr:TetR family transcriptional regulator [Auritidibacter sp. NML100628]